MNLASLCNGRYFSKHLWPIPHQNEDAEQLRGEYMWGWVCSLFSSTLLIGQKWGGKQEGLKGISLEAKSNLQCWCPGLPSKLINT